MDGPNGAPAAGATPINQQRPPVKKKKPVANPLMKPKRPPGFPGTIVKKAVLPSTSGDGAQSNGSTPPGLRSGASTPANDAAAAQAENATDLGGWSAPLAHGTQELPIYTTRRALRELRYHIMRLRTIGGRAVNIMDPEEFPPPLFLYRKDISAPSIAEERARQEVKEAQVKEEGMVIDQNAEQKEIARQEREAIAEQRAINQLQIAPSAGPEKPRAKKDQFMKAFKNQATAEGRAESNASYEENLPWHFENGEGSIEYSGAHQAALEQMHCVLIHDPANRQAFQMVPIEKWHQFKEQPKKFRTFTSDEAEKLMKGKVKMPKWFVRNQNEALVQRKTEREGAGAGGMYTMSRVKRERAGSDAEEIGGEHAGDIDFENDDLFQDDDENDLFEGDEEDRKENKERMEKEQLQANIFSLNDERRVDEADLEKRKQKQKSKKARRQAEKALREKEGDMNYSSDDSSRASWESEESEPEPVTDEELGKPSKKRKGEELEIIIPGEQSEKEEPSTKKQKLGAGQKTKARDASKTRMPKGAVGDLKKAAIRKAGTSSGGATSGGSGTDSPKKKPKKSLLNPARNAGTEKSTPNGPGSRSPAASHATSPIPSATINPPQRNTSNLKQALSVDGPGQANGKRTAAGSGSDSDNLPLAKRAKNTKIKLTTSTRRDGESISPEKLSGRQTSPDINLVPTPQNGSRGNAPSPRGSPATSKAGSPASRPVQSTSARSPSYHPATVTNVPLRTASPAAVPTTELTPKEFLALIPVTGTILLSDIISALKPRVRKTLGPLGEKNRGLSRDYLKQFLEPVNEKGDLLKRKANVDEMLK